jgi:hypothetical protein
MNDSTSTSILRTRKQALQYLLAGTLSSVLIGTVMLYPELAGIDGLLGYPFLIVLVGYLFVLANDHVRQSQYYPLIQAVFFLSWGGYNVSRGRVGLLTIILLVGGGSTLLCGGYHLTQREMPVG